MSDNAGEVKKDIEVSFLSMGKDADELKRIAESNGWTAEQLEHAMNEQGLNIDTVNNTSPLTTNDKSPTGIFEKYIAHLIENKWGVENVQKIKDNIEETYLRIETKNGSILPVDSARYGLVVGKIQSGKTAHMLGLSFRALDKTLHSPGNSAYDVIILLSGLLDDLRNQTFNRLKETNIEGINFLPNGDDFAENNLKAKEELMKAFVDDQPTIIVIKKNHIILEALIKYFGFDEIKTELQDRRILIIDDECDHASIDSTHSEHDSEAKSKSITATNRAVRSIIKDTSESRSQRWYIGYTATPYSNLLMDPEPEYRSTDYGPSLFPRDMIHCLPPPDGHYDNEYFFTKKGEKCIKNFEAPDPESGEERIHIRRMIHLHVASKMIREQQLLNKPDEDDEDKNMIHSTMIHTEVETEQHLRVAEIVSSIKEELSETSEEQLFSELVLLVKEIYSEHIKVFMQQKESINQSEYLSARDYYLNTIVVKLNAVNDISDDENYIYPKELNYSKDRETSHIVVGGQKLARGLTIEGLTITWFDRTPKTPNYDTLLQMARWCGYRSEQIGLIRIFMSAESIQHFSLITEVEIRLRTDLLKFNKDTNPLNEVQWIREYKGMRISARIPPNSTESKNSNEKYLQAEYCVEHLPSAINDKENEKIQFDLYSAVENLDDELEFENKFIVPANGEQFKFAPITWDELEPFVNQYFNAYKSSNASKKYLAKLLTEIKTNKKLQETWNLGIHTPVTGKGFGNKNEFGKEQFLLSELGLKVASRNILKLPNSVSIFDIPDGETEREVPLLCIFLENPEQKMAGSIEVYRKSDFPVIMLAFYLPEKSISPAFAQKARPGWEDGISGGEEE